MLAPDRHVVPCLNAHVEPASSAVLFQAPNSEACTVTVHSYSYSYSYGYSSLLEIMSTSSAHA